MMYGLITFKIVWKVFQNINKVYYFQNATNSTFNSTLSPFSCFLLFQADSNWSMWCLAFCGSGRSPYSSRLNFPPELVKSISGFTQLPIPLEQHPALCLTIWPWNRLGPSSLLDLDAASEASVVTTELTTELSRDSRVPTFSFSEPRRLKLMGIFCMLDSLVCETNRSEALIFLILFGLFCSIFIKFRFSIWFWVKNNIFTEK